MINTVSELRDALMIDLESDSDIAMLDASCEVAEYAMESAAFEYDGVNTAAFEAADNNFIDKAGEFCKGICEKVKNFCIACIRTIRMILPKLKQFINMGVNKIYQGKAERMQKKIDAINDPKNKSLAAMANEKIKNSDLALLKAGLKTDPKAFVSDCLDKALDNEKIVGTKKDLDIEKDVFIDEHKESGEDRASAKDAKAYLDNAVKYLNSLNESTKLQSQWLDKMADGGNSTGIRRAMATSYNVATSAVRKYYHAAMNLAKKFVGVDKDGKILNKGIEIGNKIGKAANKSMTKYAEKHGIAQ